ncbi:SLAP domain-containing protein [Lactobacillus sp. PSON]|uniref:SLAP domain-containing protein n=1 Tax=Lactobacillus sp. PSON TaxID=3455454 RepID=UPI004041E402
MKKNLRIVSAAAAALLAVAPVAVSVVSTADAAVTVNNATASQQTPAKANALTVNVSLNATAGQTTVADAIKSVKVSVDGATVSAKNVEIVKAGTTTALSNDTKLNAEDSYQVVVKNFNLTGLTTGKEYTIAGGTLAGKPATTAYKASDLSQNQAFTSDAFHLTDKNLTGTPYFVKDNTVVTNGAVSVAASTKTVSVSDVVKAINAQNFTVKMTDGASAKVMNNVNVEAAVNAALSAAGIEVKNGSFAIPSSNVFTVNLTATANNEKSATLPVIVSFNTQALTDAEAKTYPVITYNKKNYQGANQALSLANDASFNYMPLNSSVNTKAIEEAFTAVVSSDNSTKLNVKVDTSKVNTAVAGTYPVTVSATNPSGKTSSVVFNLTVGAKNAAYKTVKTAGNIYTVNGNKATQTNNTVTVGQNVATFGTVTIDGVEYTRINSASSDEFVQSSVFTEEVGVDKTVMHAAAYYDKNGKATTLDGKKTAASFSTISVVAKPVTINGASYYKIANKDAYVKASNIDGTKRVLKHNAYIYATSKKRATKTVLKKGETVVTYGGSYKFKNGKRYYRIEGATATKKMYVKVANF